MKLNFKTCFIPLIVVFIIGASTINIKSTIKIGTFSPNTKEIELYLEEYLPTINLEVINLSNLLVNDPFEDTMEVVNSVLKNGEIDMLLGIEADYLLSQKDKSIFLNIDNINLTQLSPVIKNYINLINYDDIMFLPTSIDNTRLLLINDSILQEHNIPFPYNNLSMDKLLSITAELSNKLANNSTIYPISFGSPVDEYFFDDLDKLFLEYKYPKVQINKYAEKYAQIAQYAKKYSYTRSDIGHTYPLDYYFYSGNVAFKIATLYELLPINEGALMNNTKVSDFNYSILPMPSVNDEVKYNNSKVTLMCISSKTNNKQKCLDIVEFILSKDNALKTVEGNNPTTINVASTPIYIDKEITEQLKAKYGTDELYYGETYSVNQFYKNSKMHWDLVNSKRFALMNYLENNTSEEQLFNDIKLILNDYYKQYN